MPNSDSLLSDKDGDALSKPATPRLSAKARRAQILDQAAAFFSEHGFTAQTRALAEACGIAQRLLYRYFPSKGVLIEQVYAQEILGPFKAVWLSKLEDRSLTMEERLTTFYGDYFETVLTRRWLRLFMFASLGDADLAPTYIQSIIKRILKTIAEETAIEQGRALPPDERVVHEIAWTLHGAVSHLAIRRHLYGASGGLPPEEVLKLHIRCFLGGFAAMTEPTP